MINLILAMVVGTGSKPQKDCKSQCSGKVEVARGNNSKTRSNATLCRFVNMPWMQAHLMNLCMLNSYHIQSRNSNRLSQRLNLNIGHTLINLV